MTVTLQDAIDHLHRLAVVERKTTSTRRLSTLANLCVQELATRGVREVKTETPIPGIGRNKRWDVVWSHAAKVRLGISLKSLLKNPAGSAPNRIDDLMGELANVQLQSPEIVTGYIMVFKVDPDQNKIRSEDGQRRSESFQATLEMLSGRRAPAWAIGMVEVSAAVKVDFSSGPTLMGPKTLKNFFDDIVECVRVRNPGAF